MTQHYIHRPTPEGGDTDPRFREATHEIRMRFGIDRYITSTGRWARGSAGPHIHGNLTGTIWRAPKSDAPSPELLALAEETRNG